MTSSTGPVAGNATRTGFESRSPSCRIAPPLLDRRANTSTSSRSDSFCVGIGPSPSSRSDEHPSELQSLIRTSYVVFCVKKKHNHMLKLDQSHPCCIQKYV